MGYGKRTGKDRTCLAVLLVAVAEEQRVRGTVAVLEGACLSHEAPCQRGAVLYAAAVLNDEVVGNDAVSNVYGRLQARHQRTVLQSPGAFYLAARPYVDILYVSRVHYGAVCRYCATVACPFCRVCRNHILYALYQHRAMAVHGSDVCLVNRQTVVYGYFSPPGFAKYGNLCAATKTCLAVHQDDVAVLNEAILLYVVVGNVVLYVLYAAVIAHADVVQCGMEDTAMLAHATRHKEGLVELAQAACAREAYFAHVFQVQFGMYKYSVPVFG